MEPLKLAPRRVDARRDGNALYLSSPDPLREPPSTLGDMLRESAARAPERDFLVERASDGGLRRVTWSEALAQAEGIASWLLATQAPGTPVMALSPNSVDLALLMLGCFLAGAPFVPVSPAYSLLSQDLAKLRAVYAKVKPGVVYAAPAAQYARAVEALAPETFLERLPTHSPLPLPEIAPGSTAKILFTSGSTGFPKGVVNTHRMLCANQQMMTQCWPFLAEPGATPPVLVDWLPWSHTFGGNHNFNLVLFHAGTILVDEGRPAPGAIAATLANLRDLPPTVYLTVPAGYAALVPRLERDHGLARAFFSRLQVAFYAAAALPPDLWHRLVTLAKEHADHEVFMTTAWGSTETSPLATSTHFSVPAAGNIGLPTPGTTLKLVPNGSKLEVLVKGPSVMTEYLDEPELTRAAFDDEGFYRMGDAMKLADPEDPAAGLVFDGRVAEDFKLASGTWVSVTVVRTGLVAEAGGIIADVVVCGHDREHLGILAWPSMAGCAAIAGEQSLAALSVADVVRDHLATTLARWNATNPASSMRIARALLLGEPPSIDAGEITDKGYTNQRATIEHRAEAVAALFADPPPAGVLVLP